MNNSKALFITACFSFSAGTLVFSVPFTLKAPARGNLFAYGKPVTLQLQTREPSKLKVSFPWTLRRFPGRVIKNGVVKVEPGSPRVFEIKLGTLPRGYYELSVESGAESSEIAFGVVTDRSDRDPPAGPLNVDGATAWLERRGRHESIARVLRMIQVGWIRERFSWGAVERRKGEFKWGVYDKVARVFSMHGIRVYQIFHDSPAWSRRGRRGSRNPEDLRDVYSFAKEAGAHYKGKVIAWEVWNEPDIGFWPDLSDTFSGVQKAAYLGFKRADRNLRVLLASFCRGRSPFDDHLFAAGIRRYFDIFNWHVYAPPLKYASILSGYLDLLRRKGCAGRPIWLTEAGIRLKATEPGGELSKAAEKEQAYFVPKSFACSLAAGTDRHFFFVLPYYLERGIQFGALRADLSPRPSFVAIAAAIEILGEARFLGAYAMQQVEDYTALAFHNGSEIVLVLWSDSGERKSVSIPVFRKKIKIADIEGKRAWKSTEGGMLHLRVGPEPLYVIGPGKQILKHLRGEVRKPGKIQANDPDPIVVRGRAEGLRLDKSSDCYLAGTVKFSYSIEVCNLSEERSARGRILIQAPKGWRVLPDRFTAALPPMGRKVFQAEVTPGGPWTGELSIKIAPRFEGGSPEPAVSFFRFAAK